MFNQIEKAQYKFLGLVYTLAGMILLGITANIASDPQQPADMKKDLSKVVLNCSTNITSNYKPYNVNLDSGLKNSIRYIISTKKDVITVKRSGLKSAKYVLKDVDGMLGVCQGMKMESFCMGSSCSNLGSGGMEMKLIYNGKT
jgi:hypothetical protein